MGSNTSKLSHPAGSHASSASRAKRKASPSTPEKESNKQQATQSTPAKIKALKMKVSKTQRQMIEDIDALSYEGMEEKKMRYCTLTERIKMVCYALQMGWEPTKKNGNPWICELAVKKVSIQAGFSKPLHGEPGRFIKDLYNRMDMGVLHEDNTSQRGRHTTESKLGPERFLELFRAAQKALGANAGFREVASWMGKEDPLAEMDKKTLSTWFKNNKGKLNARTTKPALTDEQRARQLEFAYALLEEIEQSEDGFLNHCHGDEKWFVFDSNRSVNHELPPQLR